MGHKIKPRKSTSNSPITTPLIENLLVENGLSLSSLLMMMAMVMMMQVGLFSHRGMHYFLYVHINLERSVVMVSANFVIPRFYSSWWPIILLTRNFMIFANNDS